MKLAITKKPKLITMGIVATSRYDDEEESRRWVATVRERLDEGLARSGQIQNGMIAKIKGMTVD